MYPSANARLSLQNLADTGATWVQIVTTAYQARYTSTSISWTGRATPTDGDITAVVQQAHGLGLKVLLKAPRRPVEGPAALEGGHREGVHQRLPVTGMVHLLPGVHRP